MPLKIKMYSDFICPFCYIGFEVFRKLKPEFDLELDWRGFQIHPEWPSEGMLASEWRNGMDPAARQAIWQRIQAMAVAAGFEMKPPQLLTNSRLSLEATEFAKEAGVGEAFEERVYRAYFYEGLNIGNQSILADLAAPRRVHLPAASVDFRARRQRGADVRRFHPGSPIRIQPIRPGRHLRVPRARRSRRARGFGHAGGCAAESRSTRRG